MAYCDVCRTPTPTGGTNLILAEDWLGTPLAIEFCNNCSDSINVKEVKESAVTWFCTNNGDWDHPITNLHLYLENNNGD